MAKKMILCDTDVLIDYWNTNNQRHNNTKLILQNTIGLDNILLSAITKMELLIGGRNKVELSVINKNIDLFTIALLNNEITLTAFSLIQKYTLSHGLQLADAIIAATGIITETDLFTYNIRDYQFIPELKLYKP